jgi:hypothetical protein
MFQHEVDAAVRHIELSKTGRPELRLAKSFLRCSDRKGPLCALRDCIPRIHQIERKLYKSRAAPGEVIQSRKQRNEVLDAARTEVFPNLQRFKAGKTGARNGTVIQTSSKRLGRELPRPVN